MMNMDGRVSETPEIFRREVSVELVSEPDVSPFRYRKDNALDLVHADHCSTDLVNPFSLAI